MNFSVKELAKFEKQ